MYTLTEMKVDMLLFKLRREYADWRRRGTGVCQEYVLSSVPLNFL